MYFFIPDAAASVDLYPTIAFGGGDKDAAAADQRYIIAVWRNGVVRDGSDRALYPPGFPLVEVRLQADVQHLLRIGCGIV